MLDAMIKKLNFEFPEVSFSINEKEHLISIQAKNEDFGSLDIQDDYDEFIIFIGQFTHFHVECYEKGLTEEQRVKYMVGEVADFLKKLFDDTIVVWGSHKAGGGFYEKGAEPASKRWLNRKQKEWVWSGPINS